MKYTRRFEKRAKQRQSAVPDRGLAKKVLAAVTAFSVMGQPFAVLASTVTRVPGAAGGDIRFDNGKANIYAEQLVNNNQIAVNRFDQFQISAGDIANMYFKTGKEETITAGTLVNFVNNHIDVSGTVNAIKDNAIGGDLFFLSSSGMAVSNTGVINAGALTVMTPTQDFMKEILGDELHDFHTDTFSEQWDHISSMEIPINASGTITVEGKVYAPDSIRMKSAHIQVGNRENTGVDQTALLQTGTIDFSDLVNTGNVQAGLEGDLTVEKNGSGDIVLSAIATERNEKDESFDASTTDNNMVNASVFSSGTLSAAGDVDITAVASSGEEYEKYFTDESGTTADDVAVWGQIVKTKADIDISGQVTGDHINVAAESRNSFVSGGMTDVPLGNINAAIGLVSFNMDAAYAVLGSEAAVNIGSTAVLTANAEETNEKKSLNITADSQVNAAAGSSTTAVKFMNVKHSGNIPSVAAAYAHTENDANVRVEGELHAKGDTNIAATADTHLEAVSTDSTFKVGGNENDKNRINTAVTVAGGKNTSTVEITDTAKVTDIGGKLDVSAVGTNSVNTEALVEGKEAAVAATAVNVTEYESAADVIVNSDLTGDGVSVTAGNLVTDNTVTADNSIGSGMLMTGITATGSNAQTVNKLKEKIGKIKEKIMSSTSEETTGTFIDKLGDMISVGASVAVADESNAAHVSIGKDVQITAQNQEKTKGNIDILANNVVADTQMKALADTSNYSDEQNQKFMASAAVLYTDISNEADVTIAGGDTEAGQHAAFSGADVSIRANSEFQYGRIDRMIGDLLLMCEKLKGAYASNADYKKHVEELAQKAEEYRTNAANTPGWANSQKGNQAMLELAAAAQQVGTDASDSSVASQIKDIFMGPFNVAGAAAAFANPGNYANFQVSSGNSGKGDATLSVAGSANINHIANNASVRIGRNAEITAADTADLAATVTQKDVALSGKIGLNSGAKTAAGGTAGIHFGRTDSLVSVAEGAKITGAAVNATANNDVMHTGLVIGAGKGGSNGFSGMVNYMEGDSSSVVSVDDEAVLTAQGKGTEAGQDDGGVRLNSGNTTVITNLAGGGAIGQASAIGASVAVTDYTVDDIAAVADNDADASGGEDATRKRLLELVRSGLTEEEQKAIFGTAASQTAGGINAHLLDVSTLNDSMINTVTIAGSAATGDDSDEPGITDKVGNFFNNKINGATNLFSEFDSYLNEKISGVSTDPNLLPTDMKPSNSNMGAKLPSLSITGAGSASVNLVEGTTSSLVDGAHIQLDGNSPQFNVAAEDDSFIGAWSGAAAITWKQAVTEQNWDNKNVGLSGAVAVNRTDTAAVSRISNTEISGAASIVNAAKKGGALVAAGLGLSAAKAGEGGGQSYNGAASVSVNDSENTVEAVMENNQVNNQVNSGEDHSTKTVLRNSAYDKDTQVTGGVNASLIRGGNKGVAVGGTVGYSQLTNTVTSAIRGGTYKQMGTVDVAALTDITQVGVAAGVSASTNSSAGDGGSFGFNGVAAYNGLTNTVKAEIENASITAEKVGVRAQDTDLKEKKYDQYISDRGLDATGQNYIDNVKDTATDLEKPGTTGNTIVTGALGISATTDNKGGAGAAAVSVSDINNDFDAHITGGSVTASGIANEKENAVADVAVYAKSDTLLVGVAAGGSGTKGNISGVGSLTWQTIDNDTTASIEKTDVHADSVSVNALTGSLGVNVAGQIGVGKTAVGLALAYNNIDNTTGAYMKGATVDRYATEGVTAGDASVTVASENAGKLYAVGAGVSASTDKLAANGTIAVNIGRNNTEAVIDQSKDGTKTTLNHIKDLHVTTLDSSNELALAGGVGAGGSVAVGGAVAYNEIGSLSGSDDEKKQQNTAKINHTDISANDGASVEVSAEDTSVLKTASVGIGIASGDGAGVAVQGAAATALIHKNTEASMDGTNISRAQENGTGAAVSVSADSANKITTTADVASITIGETNVSVGAGVAVNRSESDVNALISGGSQRVQDLRLDAGNRADITTIGVGASIAGGTGAGVTGSVAVNQIGNQTGAVISGGADISASGNVIVTASGDESIANYAGNLAVAGKGAAVGLSVSVNEIDSGTSASIEGDTTKVSASGNGKKAEVKDSVDSNALLDNFVDESAFDSTDSLADERKNSEYSGIAVSASSTHTLKSFLVNGGVAGQGAAVNGTVNVNVIGGSTSAGIRGADINAGSDPAGDVHITAHDYANSAGIVGTASIAGEGAGVGLGSDTNTVSRNVSAELLGKGQADADGRYGTKNTVHAAALTIDADAGQGISSLTTGISASGIGAGVSNATSVALLEGKTTAGINGAEISAASLAVTSDHIAKMNTLGIAVGAGGVGAGVGIGVSVLNENSETTAEVMDADIGMTGTNGDVTVQADNQTKVNYQLYNMGGGIVGAAGSIGVSNVKGKVSTRVIDAAVHGTETGKAEDILIKGQNTLDFTNKAGTGSVGAVGVGVGVAVNTIDSQVQTQVEHASLEASGTIDVSARETRTVNQLAVNAAAGGTAGGANVMVTNIGSRIEGAYGSNLQIDKDGKADPNGVNIDAMYTEANDAVNGNRLQSEYTLGRVKAEDPAAGPSAAAGKGGEQESIVKVKVDGSTLTTGGKASVHSEETTTVNMDGITATASIAGSVSGTVGILNVHRNSGVEMTSSQLQASDFEALAKADGKSDLDIYQGTVGGSASIGAAYGSVSTNGDIGVGIGGSSIATSGNVSVTAEDASQADIDAIGVSLAIGGAASVITAEGTNRSETTATIDRTEITAGKDISIAAKREAAGDSLHVRAIAGSGGLIFAGAGVGAVANEMGIVGTEVTGGSRFSAGNAINLSARNAPSVSAETGAVSGSLFASAAVTAAEVHVGEEDEKDHLKTTVQVDDSNTFTAKNMTAKAEADVTQNVSMKGISISANPFAATGTAQVNTGSAKVYSDVDVNIGASVLQGTASGGMDLNVRGNNTVTQTASAEGISAGTGFATGTNLADTTAHLSTEVTAAGNSESRLNNADIRGSSFAKVDNDANGYGGALIDISPYAAMVDNDFTSDTDVTLRGTWDVSGELSAQALNGMDIDLDSDAVRAAIVGGSGTWLHNVLRNSALVTLDGAAVTTGGAQRYTAQNQVKYTGKIDGSGYGGVGAYATDYADDLDFNAGVTVTNSTLRNTGSGGITAQATTGGTISSKNSLKSAGVIPIALAFSNHSIDYNNAVSVDGNSTLMTDKAGSDITLAAADDTDVKLETIADTQGGAVGAASAEATNTMNRSNKITLGSGSTLHSTNDINLYAGADADGVKSSLNLQVLADAYNNTVIPLCTAPKVNNTMTQANQVELAGTAESVRHINAGAAKGTTTVTESAREYKLWTGTGGSGSVSSTALGDDISSETETNFVNVTGSATAGIHNKLDITIGGQTTTQAPSYNGDKTDLTGEGSLNYEGITVNITEGSDWFDAASLKPDNMTLKNGLMDRYNEVMGYLQAYGSNKDSEAYKAYEAEKSLLLLEMEKAGLAEKSTKNGVLTPLDSIKLPAIEIPDIVVSGGNINIDADQLKGTGSLTAQGAPQLSITNNSDLYLKVNDLTISDNGGSVNMTGVKTDGFSGKIASPGVSGETPKITIHGASADASAFGTDKHVQADIGIFGDITNSAGDIEITSDNYNILMQGSVNGRNITVKAAKGDVTQTNSEGLVNVGNDPIARLQFSEAVAKTIQTYLYKQGSDGKISFSSYREYLKWLHETIGISLADLGITQEQYDNPDLLLTDEKAGILAGGNIYIDAVNVNIGGLVQSGYGKYETTLTADAQAKVDKIAGEWNADRKPLTDADVMGKSEYLVNNGGAVWDDQQKVWNYEVKVYYNPSTGQLLTESVRPEGGQIQISGKVSSTGGGRIMAMDGTADIHIDTTAVNKDVKVNSITNNDISGLITITDKNQTDADGDYLVTEYKNGAYRQYYTGDDTASLGWKNGTPDYKPEAGSQFAWTGGVTGETITEKHYTEDFLFWGALAYDKSETLLDHITQVGGTVEAGPPTSNAGASIANGSLVTGGYEGGNNMLTIRWDYSKNTAGVDTDPSVKKEYDGTAGKIFGYGKYTYTWTTTTGDQVATATGLKADNAIGIGFLGNGNSAGNISVSSAGDMLLNGAISNAAVIDENYNIAGKGNVTLTSTGGGIYSAGQNYIASDDVNLHAGGDIAVNHAAIGGSASVDAVSENGSVSFVSSGGDLHISQAAAGGTGAVTAETGNVYVEAAGDILDAHTFGNYAVKGQRIDLVSKGGSIGTKDQALTILGGSELYSSDSMASSVNASASGDIVLTQTEGNMRLGTIVSGTGDAMLTVADSSFVDAHPGENQSSSTAEDKIDRWLESGLISSADSADSKEQAAADARKERVDALTDRMTALATDAEGHHVENYKAAADAFYKDTDMQAAKAEYVDAVTKAGKDSEGIQKAYDAYQAKVSKYFSDKGFSEDEQAVITSYAEVANSENYGWSRNQLLYAIQDSVINSEPGDVLTVDTPNVSAQNITLHAANGGIGIDGEAQTISYDALDDLENMKLLANAKAGDLEWGDHAVTIRQQQAVTVQVKDDNGKVDVQGKDNVYLAGVKDTHLVVNGIATEGDIRLQGDAGVLVNGTLAGVDLTIAGGTGSIGTADDYVDTAISGTLNATAGQDIYISQTGDLHILAAAAGQDASFKATGSILMHDVEGSLAQGYLNTGHTLSLTAGGTIGTAENALRILDNGVLVNAEAGGNLYLSGVSGTGSKDLLVLGSVKGNSLAVTSAGSISLGRAENPETEAQETVAGTIETDGDVSVTAAGNIDLSNGSIRIGAADGTLNLKAEDGSVMQNDSALDGIQANTVNIATTGSQLLEDMDNQISHLTVTSLGADDHIQGSLHLTSAAENVNVDFGGTEGSVTVQNGDVAITHTGSGTLTGTGMAKTEASEEAGADITMNSKGSIVQKGSLNAGGDIGFTGKGSITVTGDAAADQNVTAETENGDIAFEGSVAAMAGSISAGTDSGAITVNGMTTAGTNIGFTSSNGSITVNGNAMAGQNVSAHTEAGDIAFNGSVEALAGDVTATVAKDGNITFNGQIAATAGSVSAETGSGAITANGTMTAKQNIGLTSGNGGITVNGSAMAGQNVSAHTGVGDIAFNGDVEATDGNVTATVTGDGDITFNGQVTATTGSVMAGTGSGAITANGTVAAEQDIGLTSGTGAITVNGEATAGKNVTAHTGAGDIAFNGSTTASDGDVTTTVAEDGNITFNGQIAATAGSVMAGTGSGAITANGTMTAKQDIGLASGNGVITVNGEATAGQNMSAHTEAGNIAFNGDVEAAAGNVTATVIEDGNITFNGQIAATAGSVVAETGSGAITANGTTTAGTNIGLTSGNGSITVNGEATADQSVTANTKDGDVAFNGNITATAGSVTAETGSGAIMANGTVTVEQDIGLTSGDGAITVTGEAIAGQDVRAHTGAGDIAFNGDVEATDGDVTATVTGDGDITFNGQIAATAGSVMAETGSGAITANGTMTAKQDIDLTSGSGAITVTGETAAGQNVSAHTEAGDIAFNGSVEALDGNVDVSVAGDGNIIFNGQVTAHGSTEDTGSIIANVSKGKGAITINGEATADQSVIANTKDGDVAFNGSITATDGNVTAETGSGAITANGTMMAKQDIGLTSGSGAITVNGEATAGKNVSAHTGAGDIAFNGSTTASDGDVIASVAEDGNITFSGQVEATTGSVSAGTATGAITANGTMTAEQDIGLTSGNGAITVNGEATAGQKVTAHTGVGDISLNGSITATTGDVTASVTGDGNVSFNGSITAMAGSISAGTGSGAISVTGVITAGMNIGLTSGNGAITVNGEATAGQNVNAHTGAGDIAFNGSTTASDGDVNAFVTEDGNITFNGQVTAHGSTEDTGNIIANVSEGSGAITINGEATADQSVTANTKDGDVAFNGQIAAAAGSVSAETGSGAITVNGTALAGQNVSTHTGAGDIAFNGDVEATDGNVTATVAEGGDITFTGQIAAAAGSVMAETGSGVITANGTVAAEQDIGLTSGSGAIMVNGEATAGRNMSAHTGAGDIAFNGSVEATAGDVTASVAGDGSITFNGQVTAHGTAEDSGSISAEVSGTGDITVNAGTEFRADQDILMQAETGSIHVHADLTAGRDIALGTNRGDIFFAGNQDGTTEEIHVTSESGNISLSLTGEGDIKDTNGEPNGDHAILNAETGNVTVNHSGIGDVNLFELYAEDAAKISTADGDLHLVNVSGNLVALVVKKQGRHMDAEHVEAATQIQIAGSNMNLDDVVQREDGDGFLAISPDGAEADTPIDNLTFGNIKSNTGVRFDHLWVNTGDIHVGQGAFHLDKVYVEDKATFSTGHMVTDVFGSAPVYDASRDSAYWVNTGISRPESQLDDWRSSGIDGRWMYLHFDADGAVQKSNGNLLHLQDHNDVYSQRYSMTDWMDLFTDEEFHDFYGCYYAPELSYHDRYVHIDGEAAGPDNADSGELDVE